MARQRDTPEQIIAKLRQAEIELSKGEDTAEVCRQIGVHEPVLRVLAQLFDVGVVIPCIEVRAHSSLGFWSPAPVAIRSQRFAVDSRREEA